MGRMLLFLVVGFGALFMLFDLNNIKDDKEITSNTYNNFDYVNAKNIAEAGIELAVSKLTKDANWTGVKNLKFDQGVLNITVTSTKSKYADGPDMGLTSAKQINSQGAVGAQTKIIKAVLNLQGGSGSTPEFLKYAVLSSSGLMLNGNTTITDDGNNNWNSDVHSNGSITLNGTGNLVNGFGTFSGYPNPINNNADIKTFIPNQNPKGDKVYQQTASITLPNFNVSDYKKFATMTSPGNVIIDKNTSLGTKDNPVIYYINGDLTVRAGITFTGYGIFLVVGTVKTEGNLLISSPDNSANNLAIYAGGQIQLDAGSKVYAQLYANSDIMFNGNVELHGLACSKGTVYFNSNYNKVYYKPCSANTTKIFQTGPGVPVILSYYE